MSAELLDRLDQMDAKLTLALAAAGGMDPEFSEEETAAILNVSVHTVQRLRYAGKLRFYRRGNLVSIGASHIREHQLSIETPKRSGLRLVNEEVMPGTAKK